MARPIPSSSEPDRVLLVEGQNDRNVVLQICKRHSSFSVKGPYGKEQIVVLDSPSASSFTIRDKEGVDEVLKSIGSEIKAPGRQAVGILVDANDNVKRRWDAIMGRLRKAGITRLPSSRRSSGTILLSKQRTGIWLMPNNSSCGELEDFIAEMIPDDDAVWPLSQRYINEIPETERKFKPKKTRRAQIHAWLAAREDPRHMGVAISAKDLEVDGVLCQQFIAWLTELFK